MTHTVSQETWDWITHFDDYAAGRITAEEYEKHVESILRQYLDDPRGVPSVVPTTTKPPTAETVGGCAGHAGAGGQATR